MGRKYNITIFGASGFTGKRVILEAVKTLDAAAQDERFSWAVAGRSSSKLDAVLTEIGNETGKDLKDIAKIVADVNDEDSLRTMAKQSDVVLNCVGPYLLYGGEKVVKACVEEGTHHLDLSGESQFLENMYLKYNKDAEEKGCYVVGSCGFDSIPADYGSVYLERNFDGQLNSVDSYLRLYKGTKVPKINYGTWHSIVVMTNRAFELLSLDRKIFSSKPYYKFQYKQPYRPIVYSEEVRGWCLNQPFPDVRVMNRTQHHKYHEEGRRPFQPHTYFRTPNFFVVILMSLGALFMGLLAQFKFGVRLLEKYPQLFSFGMIKPEGEGPSKEETDNDFTFTLVGKGWDKQTSDSVKDGKFPDPPNKVATLTIKGKNPAYGGTVTIMLQAGLTIVKERSSMPRKGGVFTPGTAFERTTLGDRLTRHGVTFTMSK